ncbi:MAG TPA: glycosyltransferase [Methylomirabilota bacterium]
MTRDTPGTPELYDTADERLLADYVADDPWRSAGIKHALRYVPRTAQRVLDIGCGVGWSTRELGRLLPAARVTGIDASAARIGLATRLTREPNVEYAVHDALEESWDPARAYDAIVLLDVYEHVPVARRSRFHQRLATLLGERGVVIIGGPSPEHQAYLRQHNPDGLQAVDEDVDEAALTAAAAELDARLVVFQAATVSRLRDFSRAVIARAASTVPRGPAAEPTVSSRVVRTRLLEEQLQLTVLGERLLVPMRLGPVVCVATPDIEVVSETFIRNHITRLPMAVCVVHGQPVARDEQGRLLRGPGGLVGRAVRKLGRMARGEGYDARADLDRALARHLRRRGARVVLAEYGVTAVELLRACQIAGVPLVAHFHGFDAYQQAILTEGCGRRYRELFDYAHGVVAVSLHMRDQLIRLGAPAERVHVIPCGVDTRLFGLADPGSAPPLFLAVGRFVEKKAPHLLIMAMKHVLAACPDARLTMIGGGPLLPVCRQLAAALDVSHAVDFRGPQDQDVVARHMQRARVFVQHSITASDGDSEGTPISVREAQVSGLPVVGTRHTGILDCVREGESGFLVDEQDVESMAERMIRLAKDPRVAARLGGTGRRIALERYPLDRSLAQLGEVLRAAAS